MNTSECLPEGRYTETMYQQIAHMLATMECDAGIVGWEEKGRKGQDAGVIRLQVFSDYGSVTIVCVRAGNIKDMQRAASRSLNCPINRCPAPFRSDYVQPDEDAIYVVMYDWATETDDLHYSKKSKGNPNKDEYRRAAHGSMIKHQEGMASDYFEELSLSCVLTEKWLESLMDKYSK